MLEHALTRSYLFVPGDRSGFLEKCERRGADAIIIDLEDSVAPGHKNDARTRTSEWLASAPNSGTRRWVRVNPGSESANDQAWVQDQPIDGLVIPKVNCARDLEQWSDSGPLLVIVETASAIQNIREIAEAPEVARLMIGEADLGAELGMSSTSPAWISLRTTVVVASVAAGIDPPIGPVNPNFSDPAVLEDETRMLKDLGFGARALIHPSQIEPIHNGLRPTAQEVARAASILERQAIAEELEHGAYVGPDGEMVDEAIVKRARWILESATDGTP